MIFNENGNVEEKKKKPASNDIIITQILGEFRSSKINDCKKEWEMIQKCYKLCNDRLCYSRVNMMNDSFIRKWKDKPGEDASCISRSIDLQLELKDKLRFMK